MPAPLPRSPRRLAKQQRPSRERPPGSGPGTEGSLTPLLGRSWSGSAGRLGTPRLRALPQQASGAQAELPPPRDRPTRSPLPPAFPSRARSPAAGAARRGGQKARPGVGARGEARIPGFTGRSKRGQKETGALRLLRLLSLFPPAVPVPHSLFLLVSARGCPRREQPERSSFAQASPSHFGPRAGCLPCLLRGVASAALCALPEPAAFLALALNCCCCERQARFPFAPTFPLSAGARVGSLLLETRRRTSHSFTLAQALPGATGDLTLNRSSVRRVRLLIRSPLPIM
ncbi:uncharacterized protein LOC133378798 [Rhineura floridana]|uniref:uncharacterized protein LOC133378798 n=1 Tax=Rhineura floridana TaxID=261503 RepID=UPI002AC874F0|nr:uncharacterized protein LOC133378798 [Rhineura floridana]